MREPAFWWTEYGMAARMMQPAALVYGAVASSRMRKSGGRVEVPVICIGNPTLGGAGKTPAALALGKMLNDMGERPFFISRGYGGHQTGPLLVNATKHQAADVGDEPLLLARCAPTIISPDRLAGAKLAIASGASVIVMDDGLQNPSLAKDLAIAVIDGRRGVGNGCVFPAGPLRAPMAAQLEAIDAFLIVGDPSPATAEFVAQAGIKKRPVFRASLKPQPNAVKELSRRKVMAFAGIGDPEKFFMTLAVNGIEAKIEENFPDHHAFTEQDAERLLGICDREGLVPVTTEKDFVRLTGDGALGKLRARTKTLPVTLAFAKPDDVTRLLAQTFAQREK